MSLTIPDLTLPLGIVSACAGRISLDAFPDLNELLPKARVENTALFRNEYVIRLIRERFADGSGHFHLDVFARDFAKNTDPNSSFDEIARYFESINGKTLAIGFESRFLLDSKDSKQGGLVHALSTLGINLQGARATLTGANLRLADSTFKEIRWKQAPSSVGSSKYYIDLQGTLGPIPVSHDLLELIKQRVIFGLDQYVVPKQKVSKPDKQ